MLMKKLFTSMLLMAAAMVATAQNFTVTAFNGTQTLKDGDVIECGYEEFENLIYGGMQSNWNPSLVVTCHKNLTLSVTANAPAGNKIQFCGISGVCSMLAGEPITRTNKYAAGDKVDMKLDIEDGEIVEPVDMTVNITDGAETVNITVTFVNIPQEELSIKNLGAKGTKISTSGRTLNFSSDSAVNLTLYSISGQSAFSRRISGNGSINLSQLPAGVYIYRAGTKTGKIILR